MSAAEKVIEVTVKVLTDEIQAKNKQIEELQEKIEGFEERDEARKRREDYDEAWDWRHIRKLGPNDYSEDRHVEDVNWDLPVPRLEVRWRTYGENGNTRFANYGLVLKHTLGSIDHVPISMTKQSGSSGYSAQWTKELIAIKDMDMPFRDGVHAWNDAKQLGLRLFVVDETKGMWREIPISKDADHIPEYTYEDIQHVELEEEDDEPDELLGALKEVMGWCETDLLSTAGHEVVERVNELIAAYDPEAGVE